MKSGFPIPRILFGAFIAMLLTGCLFNRETISTRHFVLASISTNEAAPDSRKDLSVGIGFVKMPSYLLRTSMAIRNGSHEIEYLQDAQWGERLDQNFQRTLAANLSRLLPSDNIYLTDWPRDQVMIRVSVAVQQFEVDNHGQGILTAHWRISAPDSDTVLKSGNARLVQKGDSPKGKPEVIAATLSELVAQFSRELAQSICDQKSL